MGGSGGLEIVEAVAWPRLSRGDVINWSALCLCLSGSCPVILLSVSLSMSGYVCVAHMKSPRVSSFSLKSPLVCADAKERALVLVSCFFSSQGHRSSVKLHMHLEDRRER